MAKEYIERETAKKVLADDYAYNAAKLLDIVPAADVQEVRRGEWLEDDYGYCHCSNCRYEHDSPECITPYCPECGAKMDKE